MGHTTTLALRRSFVALTSGTSAFLRHGLFTGTSHVAEPFCFLEDVAVFVLPILKNIFDDVSAQWQVINLGIELCCFSRVLTRLKVKDGDLNCFVEWTGCPGLTDHQLLTAFFEAKRGQISRDNF